MNEYEERAEKIAQYFFQVTDSRQLKCQIMIAAELKAVAEEVKPLGVNDIWAKGYLKGKVEGMRKAAEIAKKAIADHDEWMLRTGRSWELEQEQADIANAIIAAADELEESNDA